MKELYIWKEMKQRDITWGSKIGLWLLGLLLAASCTTGEQLDYENRAGADLYHRDDPLEDASNDERTDPMKDLPFAPLTYEGSWWHTSGGALDMGQMRVSSGLLTFVLPEAALVESFIDHDREFYAVHYKDEPLLAVSKGEYQFLSTVQEMAYAMVGYSETAVYYQIGSKGQNLSFQFNADGTPYRFDIIAGDGTLMYSRATGFFTANIPFEKYVITNLLTERVIKQNGDQDSAIQFTATKRLQ